MIDGDVAQDLKEPRRELTVQIVGIQTREGADERLLRELFSDSPVADQPYGNVHR